MRKLISMLLVLILMLSGMSAMAAKAEKFVTADVLLNGDMEFLGETDSYWINSWATELETVHGGARAMKQGMTTNPEDKKIAYNRNIKGVMDGETYVVSAWIYIVDEVPTTNAMICMVPKDGDSVTIASGRKNLEHVGKKGEWVLATYEMVMPAGTSWVEMQLRVDGGGTVIWDDASVVGKTTESYAKEIETKKALAIEMMDEGNRYLNALKEETMAREIMDGAVNIVQNGSFEEGNENSAAHWVGSNGSWDKTTFIATDPADVHSGSRAGIIRTTPEMTHYPYLSQVITEGIEGGREYVLSAWVKMKDVKPFHEAVMKLEFYNCKEVSKKSAATSLGFAESPKYVFGDDEWHNIKLVCEIPQETGLISMYVRFFAPGEVVYDDIEFKLAKPAQQIDLNVYKTYVYTESETGTAFTKISTANAPIEPGNYVEFSVKDKNRNVITTEQLPAASYVEWKFKTSLLAEKQKQYFIGAKYFDASGNLIEEAEDEEVYRYDRPKRMDANGNYIDPLTGKIWYPSLGYSPSNEHDVLYMMSVGCNTFKATGNVNKWDPEALLKQLDWYQEIGAKMCLSLYLPPVGYKTSEEKVRAVVTAVKDHPAVYGYMLLDEPSLQSGPSRQVKTFEHAIDTIRRGYRLIRDIDPNNLVYCLESAGATVAQMTEVAKCTDVFALDPYPYQHETVPVYQTSRLGRAQEAMNGEFKLLSLMMAAAWKENHYNDNIVTPECVQHQTYTALWAGAQEYGYIPAHSDAGFKIETSPFREGVEAITKSGEQAIVREHFHGEKTTLFANYQGKDFWTRSWIDKKGDMYLVLLNMRTTDTVVDMPFVSDNGKVTINSATLTPINGSTEELTVTDGRIRTTLSDIQTILYKVTPSEEVDRELVLQDAFDDMGAHEWAKEAVEALNAKDIINNKGVGVYAPGDNITRADFAGFIIRTLGLEVKGADNFADVDPNHEYAKEIATGKALGIFNGTGDNKFEPEAAISRQDLMTMCYRGMKNAGVISGMVSKAWVNNFSDSGYISDYAVEAMASMIENAIVRGNGDGTVNPLGNTTRAEAAVIMNRISALRPEYKRLLA